MRQVEIAKTITFTAPRHARAFFEALAADNLDLGCPDNMEIIFNRQVRSTTKGVFRTAHGVAVVEHPQAPFQPPSLTARCTSPA
jgi:hypothetical protein